MKDSCTARQFDSLHSLWPKPCGIFSSDVKKVLDARLDPLKSPINLCVSEAVPVLLPNLEWMYLNRIPYKLRVSNTGRTVVIKPRWSSGGPRIRGGPLLSEYILSQIHFHWGQSDEEGSEHSVEGQYLPLEMHMVAYNTKYESHYKALRESDGTVVVAYFFVLQERDNPNLSELIPAMYRVSDDGASCFHPTFALSRLLPTTRSDYLIYWGTISGGKLKHRLLWMVDRKPIGISREQMAVFRGIHKAGPKGTAAEPAPKAPPGAVFYADPTRRPINTPTLLPLDPNNLASPWSRVSPKISPSSGTKSSLQSNRITKSVDIPVENGSLRQESYEIYKAMGWDEGIDGPAEKPFCESAPVPVGFSFRCRRAPPTDLNDSQPYLPAHNVAFNQNNHVQCPKRREILETNQTGYTSSGSSECNSMQTRYFDTNTVGRRSQPPVKRKRDQSSSRAASHSIDSVSSELLINHPPTATRKSRASSSSNQRKAEAEILRWSDESSSPSTELVSSDLSSPDYSHGPRTMPSIINTCGIEDIIVETLPPESTPRTKPCRATRQSAQTASHAIRPSAETANHAIKHSAETASQATKQSAEAASNVSTNIRGGSALPRDHPNTQPLLAKSMTGASVAGSFVQQEQAQRKAQEGGTKGSRCGR